MDLLTFLTKYGIRTTSNFQLIDIFSDLHIIGKVLMRDELNKLSTTKKQNIIMNLQTSKDDGSHWVALVKNKCSPNKSKDLKYYFDPYGVLPTKEVYNYLDCPFSYNKIQVQQDGTECCGQLSMYFLYRMNTSLQLTEENITDIILSMKRELDSLK